jgi:uncharacterized LabA/DUF88 family protein
MSQTRGEKGIDVALAVDALQVGLGGTIDIAVLVTGDGDFVPLVRALNKQGVRVPLRAHREVHAAFCDADDSGRVLGIHEQDGLWLRVDAEMANVAEDADDLAGR